MKKEDFEKFKDFDDGSGTIEKDWVIAQAQGGRQPLTESQIDEIIESFKTQTTKVPLRITHRETGKLKSWASFGWIKTIWKEGKQLMAKVTMNNTIHKALEMLMLGERSIGITKEKAGKWQLDHVALLGAELPGIEGMPDLVYSDGFEDVEIIEFLEDKKNKEKGVKMELKYTQEQLDSLIQAAVDKAVNVKETEVLKTFSDKETDFTTQITAKDTKIAELEKDVSAKDKAIKEFSDKADLAEATAFVDQIIRDRKLAPAQKESTVNLLTKARNFSSDYFKELKENFEKAAPVIEFGEIDDARGDDFPGKGEGKDKDKDKEIKEFSVVDALNAESTEGGK